MTRNEALTLLRKIASRAEKAHPGRYVDVVCTNAAGGPGVKVRQYLSMKEGSPSEFESLRRLGIEL